MKYIKLFSNHNDYTTFIVGADFDEIQSEKSAIVSYCRTGNHVHYNPYVQPTPVEARFDVYDTYDPTQIMGEYAISRFSAIEIDGVEQPSVVSAYTFSTEGEHIVKYTLANPTSIGSNAFDGCSDLTSVNIPDSVRIIGGYAFYNCSELTSIVIPNSVTSIDERAFEACGLTSIVIPDSVTSIGDDAFYNSSSLNNVTIMATTPPSIGDSIFGGDMNIPTINVPSGSVDAYKSTSGWSDYADIIQAIQ